MSMLLLLRYQNLGVNTNVFRFVSCIVRSFDIVPKQRIGKLYRVTSCLSSC